VVPSAIVIPSRAVTILALAMNEMISNAIKHGLAGQSRGTITIRGFEEEGTVIVQVIDTGPPFEACLEEAGEGNSEGLGLSLIKNLIGDLGGKFSLRREVIHNGGSEQNEKALQNGLSGEYTVAEVRFPLVRSSSA